MHLFHNTNEKYIRWYRYTALIRNVLFLTTLLGPALRKELCNRKVDKYGPASSFGNAEELSYRHSWSIGRVFDRIQWSTPPIPSRQRGTTRPIIRIIGPVVYEKR